MAGRNRVMAAMLAGVALSLLFAGQGAAQSRMFDPGVYPTWPDDRADRGDPHWVMDDRTQCLAFDADAGSDDSVTWTGGCRDGKLFGFGTLTFYDRGRVVERLTGMFERGIVEDGQVHIAWGDGSSYDGMEARGNLNGEGQFVDANGRHYDGTWENGNFKGPRLASIPDRVRSDAITPLIGDTPQQEAGVKQQPAPTPIQNAHAASPAAPAHPASAPAVHPAAAPAQASPAPVAKIDENARKHWAFLGTLHDASLVAVDGARMALKLSPSGQLRRTVTRADGSVQVLQLAFLNDRQGTARDARDRVVATFRVAGNAIEVTFQDGRIERLAPNGASLAVAQTTPGAKPSRTRWYPEGHVFGQAEKKALLAQVARALPVPAAVTAKPSAPPPAAPKTPRIVAVSPPPTPPATQKVQTVSKARWSSPALAALTPRVRPAYRPATPDVKRPRAEASLTPHLRPRTAMQVAKRVNLNPEKVAQAAQTPPLRRTTLPVVPPTPPVATVAPAPATTPVARTVAALAHAMASPPPVAPPPALHFPHVVALAKSIIAPVPAPAPAQIPIHVSLAFSAPKPAPPPAQAKPVPPKPAPPKPTVVVQNGEPVVHPPQVELRPVAVAPPKTLPLSFAQLRIDPPIVASVPQATEVADMSAALRAIGPIHVEPRLRPAQPGDVSASPATPLIIPPRRTASNCLSVESDGLHWGFRNHCAVDLQFAYCVMKGADRLTSCGQSVVPGSVAANGFGALVADTDLKRPDATHAFRWVACVGGAGEVVPHLDQIEPAAGRCLHAGDLPPDTERAEATAGGHATGAIARGK